MHSSKVVAKGVRPRRKRARSSLAIASADTCILKLYLFSKPARSIGPPRQAGWPFRMPTFGKGNPMLNLIYMILVCHALGYGHPRELMRLAGFPTGKGSNRGEPARCA